MNHTLIALSLLVFAAGSPAFAQKVTKIEKADVICSQKGGTVVFSTSLKRVWQGEKPSDANGMEFDVKSWDLDRCPNCFTVKATFPAMYAAGQYLIYRVQGSLSNKATLTTTGYEGTIPQGSYTMDCKVKKAK